MASLLMRWTAVIPIKAPGASKTRLSPRLSDAERKALTKQMFDHVAGVASATPGISEVMVLASELPLNWGGGFIRDEGRGLNPELEAAVRKLGSSPLLIVHADLPLLETGDLAALLEPAEARGHAIAPDRHNQGTNALALSDPTNFPFAFGVGSFAAHLEATRGSASIIRRLGLSVDLDTPDDMTHLFQQAGWFPHTDHPTAR